MAEHRCDVESGWYLPVEASYSRGDVIISYPIFLTDDRPEAQARVPELVAGANREAGLAA
jgi:hypothetical protein